MGRYSPTGAYCNPSRTGNQAPDVGFNFSHQKFLSTYFPLRIIHTLITSEEQYIKDLDIIETIFIKPLQRANPPIISSFDLEEFIDEVFHNILDIRECNKRLLEVLYVRQREQGPVIGRIGDVFLDAATEFRIAYPTYVGHHPRAEKRVKEELERNSEFRLFIEVS